MTDPTTPSAPETPPLPPFLWREEVVRGAGFPGILIRTPLYMAEGFTPPPDFAYYEGIVFITDQNGNVRGETRFVIPVHKPNALLEAIAAYHPAFLEWRRKQTTPGIQLPSAADSQLLRRAQAINKQNGKG